MDIQVSFFLAARLVVFEVLVLQAQGTFLQSVKSSLEIFPQTFFFVSHFGLFSSRWQWIIACTNCDNNGNSCGSRWTILTSKMVEVSLSFICSPYIWHCTGHYPLSPTRKKTKMLNGKYSLRKYLQTAFDWLQKTSLSLKNKHFKDDQPSGQKKTNLSRFLCPLKKIIAI